MARAVRADINTKGLFGFQAGPITTLTNTPGAPIIEGVDAGQAQTPAVVDSYSTRIVKYVPAEVIAFYLAADKLFVTQQIAPTALGAPPNPDVVTVVLAKYPWPFSALVFLVALIGVPLYLRGTTAKGQPIGVQTVLAMIAFVIWSYAVQGSVFTYDATHHFYNSTLASFTILVFTFLAGFVVPGVGKDEPTNQGA